MSQIRILICQVDENDSNNMTEIASYDLPEMEIQTFNPEVALDEAEASWFQQKFGRSAPIWLTRYDDYREVGGVLLAHHWSRSMSTPPPRTLQLYFNIAINGAEPDTVAPEL